MNSEEKPPLVSRPIMFDSSDLKAFDKIVGNGNRSKAVRKWMVRFIKSHADKQKLEE